MTDNAILMLKCEAATIDTPASGTKNQKGGFIQLVWVDDVITQSRHLVCRNPVKIRYSIRSKVSFG